METIVPYNRIPITQLDRLRRAVGEWSQANFGDNLTDLLPTYSVDPDVAKSHVQVPMIQVGLNSLCPLLGLFEEVGELYEATSNEQEIDAIGDIGIYLCDYVNREELTFAKCFQEGVGVIEVPLPAAVGKLSHCVLKRFQGIRGMDDFEKFREVQKATIGDIVVSLVDLSQSHHNTKFDDIVSMTWSKIVAKRNWVANKAHG
jgi:hypothetical protein